jgi:nicotinate dehydrogenase subunit B
MNDRTDADLIVEPERYELWTGPNAALEVDRRAFLRGLGGGLVVLCLSRNVEAFQESGAARRRGGGGAPAPRALSAWLHIAENGAVTVSTGKAEVGQNIRTSLAQAVAEELRVPLDSIDLVMGDTARTPYDMGTFGSRTTPVMSIQLRRAAASARQSLLDLAAERLKVDKSTLAVAAGKVEHAATGRSLGFGELTRGQELMTSVSDGALMTPAARWNVAGRSAPKANGRDFVTGRHQYASDVKRPRMVHGKVLRPPAYGATLTSLDTSAAEAITGVTVVRDGEFVGVAAPDEPTASRALAALKPMWKLPTEPASDKDLFDVLTRTTPDAGKAAGGRGRAGASAGPAAADGGVKLGDVEVNATYTVAYIAHAPLEPRAAVAEWEGDRLTVWTGTQRPFGVRSELAQGLGVPEERVRVIVPDTGSGYGGKHTGEAAIEAARLSRAAGRPVKRVWTREEEFTWAYFRPAGVIKAAGGAQKDGSLTAWCFHNHNSGGSGIETPYVVNERDVAFHQARSPLRQGSYRALASTANHFARESLMDELAAALRMDPLAFRMKNLKDERLRAVFQAAADRFGWGTPKATTGRGVGIAGGTEKGGYVATCAEVDVDRASGAVKVLRLVAAFECGAAVNPDHLKNQVEGALVMGLGGALFEAIKFDGGKVQNARFSRYRVPRFGDIPAIDVVLLDRKDLAPAGAGEAPIIAVAPAIGNAIFDATGTRLRSLPMLPDGMKVSFASDASQRPGGGIDPRR